MFGKGIYKTRREKLKNSIKTGVLLFLGNDNVPINYEGNDYRFRQDSSFLYYFGIDRPNLYAVIDIDNNSEIIFGNEFSIDDAVWNNVGESLYDLSYKSGIKNIQPLKELKEYIDLIKKQTRKIH